MSAEFRSDVRSLIVVSKDYGEFGLAMSFLRKQQLAQRTRMALPEALHAQNAPLIPVPSTAYATGADLLALAEEHEPDVVLFFSGYLLGHDGLLDGAALQSLVDGLRARGCRLATSDPFLGMAPRLTLSEMNPGMLLSGMPAPRRWLHRAFLRLLKPRKQVVRVESIECATHLYPTSVPKVGPDDGIARMSFFNPALIREGEPSTAAADAKPRWLFVLSKTDLNCQRRIMGLPAFAKLVARLLQRSLECGMRPTLLGPPAIVEVLREGLEEEIELSSFLPFDEFEERILDAQYVFYWNAFSFSMIPRIANARPVFLFDSGHLTRTIKPFYRQALATHFGGWAAQQLDPSEAPNPELLALLAQRDELGLSLIGKRWKMSPSPDEVLARIMSSPG